LTSVYRDCGADELCGHSREVFLCMSADCRRLMEEQF
jgi:hypothetical protein